MMPKTSSEKTHVLTTGAVLTGDLATLRVTILGYESPDPPEADREDAAWLVARVEWSSAGAHVTHQGAILQTSELHALATALAGRASTTAGYGEFRMTEPNFAMKRCAAEHHESDRIRVTIRGERGVGSLYFEGETRAHPAEVAAFGEALLILATLFPARRPARAGDPSLRVAA